MYASAMLAVRRIPPLLLLLAACGSPPEDLPPIFPPAEAPRETVVREPPAGFLGDPATRIFHRVDCPEAAAIDPAHREFWAWPWQALDAGYAPCRACEPMRGFK
jgi:hypothetical protein